MKKINLPYLQIEPSTICNYTCGFCAGRHMTQKHMEMETFSAALNAIEGLKYITIQGEGEPLLHPHFFEMVRIVRETHPQASVSFITNGSLFSTEHINEILNLGITRIMVSIESANAETFKDIRGGKLEKVIGGIRKLLKERNSRKLAGPALGFATTVLKSTMRDFKDVINLYRDLGMDGGIVNQYLQKMESYAVVYDDNMKKEILEEDDVKWFENALINDFPLGKIGEAAEGDTNFYSSLLSSETMGCPWLAKALYVNRDGIATGCCQIKDAEKNGFGKLTIDTGELIMKKREAVQNQLFKGEEPSECKNCFVANNIIRRHKELPPTIL